MSIVFLRDQDGNVITYDAVENITISRSASVTKHTVQSGRKLTDHYHSDLPSITFSGIVTSSKIRDIAPTPAAFTVLVNNLIDTAVPFTLFGDPANGIPNFNNCLIISFEIIKGVSNLDSLQAAITIQQIDIGAKAQLGNLAPSITTKAQLEGEVNTGTGTKTDTSKDTNKYTQLFKRENGVE